MSSTSTNPTELDLGLMKLLAEHINEDSKLAFLAVDEQFRVCEVSPNCELFLGLVPSLGARLDETVDCMVGLDFDSEVRWPIVENDQGLPMALHTVRLERRLYVLMTDASESLAQQKALQQIANDNELLVLEKQTLLRDLERKTRALEQASRLQTAFLAGVAHEFRTPLVSILGYSELVTKVLAAEGSSFAEGSLNAEGSCSAEGSLNAEGSRSAEGAPKTTLRQAQQWVQGIQRSGRHLLSLIENLLDHGKGQSEQLQLNYQPVNIKTLLEDIEMLMMPQSNLKRLTFKTQLNGSTSLKDCWVMADESRLTQCLINLVGNAIKFTDHGHVSVSANYADQKLVITVQDSGIGMSEQELAMVREPFWQASHQQRPGTGLGVTITSGIIDLMGGQLRIESAVNKGTTVEISLPVAPASDHAKSQSRAQDLGSISCRLLMVEDDDDIAIMLEALLMERGFEVLRVANGRDAVQVIQSQSFDMVLMDVVLPTEDGFEVAVKLRAQEYLNPIVMMSASHHEFEARNSEPLLYDGYLVKPIAVNDVVVLAKEFAAQTE